MFSIFLSDFQLRIKTDPILFDMIYYQSKCDSLKQKDFQIDVGFGTLHIII